MAGRDLLRLFPLAFLVGALNACIANAGNAAPAPPTEIRVGPVIEVIKRALTDAQTEIGQDQARQLPELASVTLTLATKATGSAALGFDLVVVSAQAKQEGSATQTLTIKLRPPPPRSGFKADRFGKDLYTDLLNAIKGAAVAAKAALDAGAPNLVLDNVTITIGFDVKQTVGGGFKLLLGSVTVGPNASKATEGSQKVELTFQDRK